MKCPRFHAALINDRQRCRDGDDDCIKEECALWDKQFEQCAVLDFAQALEAVREELGSISDKTPPRVPRH